MLIESIKMQFTLNPMYVFEDLYTLLCEKLVQLVAGFSVLSLLQWVNLLSRIFKCLFPYLLILHKDFILVQGTIKNQRARPVLLYLKALFQRTSVLIVCSYCMVCIQMQRTK